MNELTAYEEAQNGLISSLLYLPGRVKDVIDLIHEEDFDNGRLQTIWKAIVYLDRHDQAIDYPNIISIINSKNKTAEVGGVAEIQRLFNEGAISASMSTIETYAQVVKNEAVKRSLQPVFSELSDRAGQAGGNAKKLIESGKSALDEELMHLSSDSDVVKVSDYFDDYMDDLSQKRKLYKEFGNNPLAAQNGIASGFKTIDKYVGGFLPGQVITVGARTSIGKSFLLTDFALCAANSGVPVLFFNLEMLPSEIMNRLIAANSNILLTHLKEGSLSDDEFNKVMASREEIKRLPIEIDSTAGITVDHIRAKSQQKATSPEGLGMVAIDYLQLVKMNSGMTNDDNRQQQVANMSRDIKMLSMSLKIPIIQAVMLNRMKRGDENPMPTRDDIRESGSIASDSSVVILIHRDSGEAHKSDDATFIIDKNRNGRDHVYFKCHNVLKYAKFVEVENQIDDDADLDGDGTPPPLPTDKIDTNGKIAAQDDRDVFDEDEDDL